MSVRETRSHKKSQVHDEQPNYDNDSPSGDELGRPVVLLLRGEHSDNDHHGQCA